MVNNHYNAFISYRHCEPDATIAGRIQRQLEHFRVPSAIAKKTGIKKIDRVFRDKEELPLCSNLGDDIADALENSDFLILICSPRTKESAWVTREVELFLQTHGVEKVLTVLVEGEPQDVVPQILMTDREPLSCDYRINPKKAKRDELPRLASAILGCRYDDLRQRQRQYQARRRLIFLSILLAVAVGLSAYFFYTTKRVERYYNDQLRSQSKYLAAESLQALEGGDRLTAIDLALYALDGGHSQRPWVAEAEYALGCAVGAYASTESLRAVNCLEHVSTVEAFFTTQDGRYLISYDRSPAVYIWDTQTHKLVQRITAKESIHCIAELPDHRVIFTTNGELGCYDYLTGQQLWTNADVGIFFVYENGVLACSGSERAMLLSEDTGKPIESIDGINHADALCVSDDGRKVAYEINPDFATYQVAIYDRDTKEISVAEPTMEVFNQVSFHNDQLFILGAKDYSGSEQWNIGNGFVTIEESQMELYCIDANTAETVWHTELPYHLINYSANLTFMRHGQGSVLLASLSNLCYTVDMESGQIVQKVQLPDSAVSIVKKGNTVSWFLKNGYFCNYTVGDSDTVGIRYFPDKVDSGTTKGGNFVLNENQTRIVVYDRVMDESLQRLEETDRSVMFGEGNDEYLLVCDYDYVVHCYRLKPQWELVWTQQVPKYCQYVGMTDCEAFFFDKDELTICTLADGSVETQSIASESEHDYTSISGKAILSGEEIAFLLKEHDYADGSTIEQYSMLLRKADGSIQTHTLMVQTRESTYWGDATLAFGGAENGVVLSIYERDADWTRCDYEIYHYEVKTQKLTLVKEFSVGTNFTSQTFCADDGRFLVSHGEGATLFDKDLKQIAEISLPMPLAAACFDDEREQILLIDTQGTMYFCSQTGKILHKQVLYSYGNVKDVRWYLGEERIAVLAEDICNIIDTDSRAVYAYVPHCLHYSAGKDGFYIRLSTSEGNSINFYRRYSTKALVERAREILGDNGLSEEQKAQYGLGE